ncbi:MAG: restriction endonuclease, SacI family [bacterium]|nr:restriction endonuclease, SacI family [bacterium]
MNHKEKLLEIYKKSFNISDIDNIPDALMVFLKNITDNIDRNKGVYTVLITLMVHKLLEPKQDIRRFQNKMKGGFSARTVDTKYITPTLKELGLASMAESGWLTRSLEQPYPYTMNYEGEISGKGMKKAFLKVVDAFQKNNAITENLLRLILNAAILLKENNHVEIKKLSKSDEVLISTIVAILEKHFTAKYSTHGGSKLPVLAFYAIYKSLIAEVGRYKDCELAPLGSHTASDRTSKSAGDIQVMKKGEVFEAVEVKLDKMVDMNTVRIAYEKIVKFNPERYYILSHIGIVEKDREEIEKLIEEIKDNHGCQLIVNGLLYTLKYYLRLISNPKAFFNEYIELVENDTELKIIHKTKLRELIKEYKL